MENVIFNAEMEALGAVCLGADLQEKSKAFANMEEAIALERAASALELLALAMSQNPWAKEAALTWRAGATQGLGFKIIPGAGERLEYEQAINISVKLSAVIDFAILAAKLGEGSLSDKDANDARNSDAMRAAFVLGSGRDVFCGKSALAFKAKIDLAERELGLAVLWASRCDPEWLPAKSLASTSYSHWEKKVPRDAALTGESIAAALGWPALAVEIERKQIASAAAAPNAARPHKPGL